MKLMSAASAAVIIVLLNACATSASNSQASAETQVRERSRAVIAAEAAKDLPRIMSYWANDAVLHLDGALPIRGAQAIRDWYAQVLPSVHAFRAETAEIHVAQSADLAYETGTNYLTLSTPDGLVSSSSKYLAIWRRGADGEWRVNAIAVTNNPK